MDAAEHRKEVERAFEEAKELIANFDAKKAEAGNKWIAEMALLKARVIAVTIPLPLPGGGSIEIRTQFSETEERLLDKTLRSLVAEPEGAYWVTEIVTANPDITAEWLKTHPDDFATEDVLTAIYGFLEERDRARRDRADRLARLANFRKESEGPKSG